MIPTIDINNRAARDIIVIDRNGTVMETDSNL